jgi:RNA 2',3'-cyclic 3'-phosphodiesterase
VRLFVALPVPDEVRGAVATAVDPARREGRGLRWTRPEGWHLTVAFLGEVGDDRVGAVSGVVAAVAARHPPLELSLGAAGRFGRRVLWVGVDDEPEGGVEALGTDLQDSLADAGLPVQQRRVHAHLTLARSGRSPVDDRAVAAVEVPAARWRVSELGLWRSHLGGGPARYEEVASAPLGA